MSIDNRKPMADVKNLHVKKQLTSRLIRNAQNQ